MEHGHQRFVGRRKDDAPAILFDSAGPFRERVRVRFSRKGEIGFVSHLDLMRLFAMALRRCGLPLRFTSGFNPHPRISFPLALAVGWEADEEVMEFELAEWVPVEEVRERLARQLPGGVGLVSVNLVKSNDKAQVVEAEYRVEPLSSQIGRRMSKEALEAFLARDEVLVERERKGKRKMVNVRPYVREARADGGAVLMRMSVSAEGTARPEEVLEAVGLAREEITLGCRISRMRVKLAEDQRS